MNIKKVDIWHLNCKFRYPFKHKLATHTGSDNLVVRLATDEGITGFGEGIPWDFVNGETPAANLAFLKENLVPVILRFPAVSLSTLLPSLRLLQEKSGGEPPRGFLS